MAKSSTSFKKGERRFTGKAASQYKHGMYGTSLYKKWRGMKNRCQNPNDPCYERYGGRGIKVCDRWQEFEAFYDDMSPTYKRGLTLERINNDIGYCPENCEWVTLAKQATNRRNVHRLEWEGEIYTAKALAEKVGMKPQTLTARLRRGWSVQEAVTTPVLGTAL
jgi:hypothetical protein